MSGRLIERPSPNFNARAPGTAIDILLLHYTGMQTAEAALSRLTDAAAQVSSHYTIDEDGTVYAHVDEQQRAWHAGASFWAGATDINSHAIGIEIVNPGHEFGYRDFPPRQIESLIHLAQGILARHPIPAARVLAHSDVAPARKEDPGERFPWPALAEAGVGLWPKGARRRHRGALKPGLRGPAVAALQRDLACLGYGVPQEGVYDEATQKVVLAFQRHFHPERLTGAADGETLGRLARLLEMV